MSTLVQFSIFPVDKGDSLSNYVKDAVKIIAESGLTYKLGPMGTSIEGDWQDIIKVITQCFDQIKKESKRVYMTLSVDYRKDNTNRITGKIASIEEKLGYEIQK